MAKSDARTKLTSSSAVKAASRLMLASTRSRAKAANISIPGINPTSSQDTKLK